MRRAQYRPTSLMLALAVFLVALATRGLAQSETNPAVKSQALPKTATSRALPSRPGKITTPKSPRRLVLSLSEAVKLATSNNTALRARYYDHLIEQGRIEEAKGEFDPTLFAGTNAGTSEVVFPQIFPTGIILPDGSPEFFQTIVNDSSDLANFNVGIRGKFTTGATYQLNMNADYRDREAGGLVNPSWNTNTSLTLTQPILRDAWEQFNLAAITQAKYSAAQSRQQYRLEVLQKILDVHRAYWEYVFSVQDLEVKKQSYDRANTLLAINRVKVETGVFAPIEIASAESEVANRVTDVLVGENTIMDRADGLRRVILDFESEGDWDIEISAKNRAEETSIPIPDLDQCIKIALKERPDLSDARLGLRSRAVAVAVADTSTLPKLDLTGSASWVGLGEIGGETFKSSFGPRGAETWNVGLVFEVPLGNKAARARLVQRRLERDRAILNYRDLKVNRVEEVRISYRKVKLAEKTIVSRKRAAQLKQEELNNEQIKLENKVSTNFQVTQVQEDLALRQSELIRALVDHRVALAELAFAMGSSTEVLNWRVAGQ
ncbi:MAG: TolC family protein [Planctomycetota bacterium]